MYTQIVVSLFRSAHLPLLEKTAPVELASAHARQEVALHFATCAVAEAFAAGGLSIPAQVRLTVGTYLLHMNLSDGRDIQAPETEAQLLVQVRAAAAERRRAHIERMRRDPLDLDDDVALLVAIEDADLHSLIDHQDATGQLLVVRERIYGQPETTR